MVPVPTRYAVSHVEDLKSSFEIFMTPSIKNTVLRMTNLEGRCVYGDSWKDLAKRVMVDLAEGLRVHNFTCNFFFVSCLGWGIAQKEVYHVRDSEKEQAWASFWTSCCQEQEGNIFSVCLHWKSNSSLLLAQEKEKCPAVQHDAQTESRTIFLEQLGNTLVKPHIERKGAPSESINHCCSYSEGRTDKYKQPNFSNAKNHGQEIWKVQVCPKRNDSKTSTMEEIRLQGAFTHFLHNRGCVQKKT